MVTKFDELNAMCANAKIVTALPTAPYQYYGVASNDVDSTEWRGGEMAFMKTGSSDYRGMLYVQVSTSGTTAIWTRLLETLATSTSTTTSTSTSSSSTTTGE
jgi:hypothetical protein